MKSPLMNLASREQMLFAIWLHLHSTIQSRVAWSSNTRLNVSLRSLMWWIQMKSAQTANIISCTFIERNIICLIQLWWEKERSQASMFCRFPEHNFFCIGFLCLDPTCNLFYSSLCTAVTNWQMKAAMVASQMLDLCQQFSFQRLPRILFIEEVYYNAKHFYYIKFNKTPLRPEYRLQTRSWAVVLHPACLHKSVYWIVLTLSPCHLL